MHKIPQGKVKAIVREWYTLRYPTIEHFVDKYQTSQRTMRKIITAHDLPYSHSTAPISVRVQQARLDSLQDSISKKLVTTYMFQGDGIITADYHHPCVSLPMVDKVIAIGKRFKIRRLFIAGDYFNLDILSAYAKKMGGDEQVAKMSEEMLLGTKVLKLLSKQFHTIIYSMGNHEARFGRALLNTWTFELISRWLDQATLQFVDQYWFYLDDIRVTHPKSYSQTKLAVAMRLCDKFNCDVIAAHGHFCSIGYSRGGHRAIDLGCKADSDRIAHMTKADTTHPFWNQGFAMYKGGDIAVFAKGYGV